MAGRRGGRGGAGRGISFNIENLGFGRGESLPGPILQPPALFPPLEQKPVPLQAGEEGDYLLALKQEYQGSMKESVYFLKELQRKRDIERYSDKYQLGQGEEHWEPDWSRIPSELRVNSKTKRKKVAMVPSEPAPDVPKTVDVDITKQLEVLEKKEADGSDKDEAAEDENADNEDLEEFYDEEEMEEETDYNMTYFDNGEIDADDDDLDDGPVY